MENNYKYVVKKVLYFLCDSFLFFYIYIYIHFILRNIHSHWSQNKYPPHPHWQAELQFGVCSGSVASTSGKRRPSLHRWNVGLDPSVVGLSQSPEYTEHLHAGCCFGLKNYKDWNKNTEVCGLFAWISLTCVLWCEVKHYHSSVLPYHMTSSTQIMCRIWTVTWRKWSTTISMHVCEQ